ncbi:MAG: hypothetical protein KDA95_10435, partial [Acidimicrobiales bacterium]|nr:hypothetical protein [Acidimicrobiales bacterium]
MSWQLLPLEVLKTNPLEGIWYLHTQPPIHNLVVGSVVAWSPFPAMGTLMVMWLLTLVAATIVLADILAGLRLHPIAAGVVATVAMANPNLLTTINIVSYEVPVAFMLICAVWFAQRYLRSPDVAGLVGLTTTLTMLAMTRSLFHPLFVVAVVLVVGVSRKAPWRLLVGAALLPVLVVGLWMGKNAVVVDRATASSWFGFNLQRGITATMTRDSVEADVEAGRVSALALEYPWGPLSQYEPFTGPCEAPYGDSAALTIVNKTPLIPNFNHGCYLAAYDQAAADASNLVKEHPAQYLSTRRTVLASSYAMASIGQPGYDIYGTQIAAPDRTWLDELGDVWLLPSNQNIHGAGWNLPLLGDGPMPF